MIERIGIGVASMRMLVIFRFLVPTAASSQEASPEPAGVRTTIERGLEFLTKDALAWKEKHNCVSCHHAALAIWAMQESRQRGFEVDDAVLADLTKWVAESGDGKFGMERPAEAPNAFSPKSVWFSVALGTDPELDDASRRGLERLLSTVKDEQTENGSWSTWPKTRPPIFGSSDETATALATLALLSAAADDETARAIRDKGVKWLSETKSDDDPQSNAMRLVLWTRLGRPADEWKPLIQRIKSRQNADGGWSQTTEMGSDAWATGQALYALAHAELKQHDPVLTRGQDFLRKTQRDDGSWSMTSRPTETGGTGANYLIPITGAGSAWAVLGLVRSRSTDEK